MLTGRFCVHVIAPYPVPMPYLVDGSGYRPSTTNAALKICSWCQQSVSSVTCRKSPLFTRAQRKLASATGRTVMTVTAETMKGEPSKQHWCKCLMASPRVRCAYSLGSGVAGSWMLRSTLFTAKRP